MPPGLFLPAPNVVVFLGDWLRSIAFRQCAHECAALTQRYGLTIAWVGDLRVAHMSDTRREGE
jgi:hypothetical protein